MRDSVAPAELDLRSHDWRSLIEQLPLAVYIDRLDESSSNVYTSPQLEAILGYTAEEWAGDDQFLLKVLHPEDRERVMAAHRHSLQTGEPFGMEYRLIARDGRVVWFLDRASVVPGQSGKPAFHHGFYLDISERKELEKALEESTAELRRQKGYFESLLDISPVAIVTTDLDDVVTSWNPAAQRLFGYSQPEALGRRIDDLVARSPELRAEAASVTRRVLRETRVQAITQRAHKDGSLIDVELLAAPVVVGDKLVGTYAIYHDISEVLRLHAVEREYLEQVGHVVAAGAAVENATFAPESLDHVAARDDAIGQLARVFRRLAREHGVARSLAETADPRDALARALRAIGESLGWQFGAVWEPAGERPERLQCVETWSAGGAAAREFEAASRSVTLAASEGLPGRVWRSGEPAWVADVLADGNFPRAAAARRAGLRAAACFPIRSARRVLGVIEFFTGEPRRVDAELLKTMSTLGDQIGQAVERRRDAEALRAEEARHRAMLDAALDCVVTIDHEGRVVDFNPAAERTFGYRAADAVGRPMVELIVPPELRERHRRGLARYLATEKPVLLNRRLEITGMRADGSIFPVELAITRIDVPGPPKFTGYLRDITERKAAEAELRQSRARIVQAADDARRRLERDLHDGAQQRFTTAALMLRAAEAQFDGAANPALADALAHAVDELKAGLAELRALARGLHPAILTNEGLVPALQTLAGRAPGRVQLRADAVGRLPGPVETAAYFVVSEALTNVAKYAADAAARVTVERHDGTLTVEVADDGPGGATMDGGSGLRGLSDRVAAVDGRLELHSPPRVGTRVRCELPCA